MILSGKEILNRLDKDIFISPFDEKRINPNSYNVQLHHDLMVYDEPLLDMKKDNKTRSLSIPEEGLVIEPGTLYLGRTLEHTRTENLVPMLEGRSSVGRLGLFIHVTAGFGDVGFNRFWTLEIASIQPVRIMQALKLAKFIIIPLKVNLTTMRKENIRITKVFRALSSLRTFRKYK